LRHHLYQHIILQDYIGGNFVCNGTDRCSCNNNISNFGCGAEKKLTSQEALVYTASSVVTSTQITVKRYPVIYNHDITFFWTFNFTSLGNQSTTKGLSPWTGHATLNADESEVLVKFDIGKTQTSQYYEFTILNCSCKNSSVVEQSCSVIFPSTIPIIITTSSDDVSVLSTKFSQLPNWMWYLLLIGVAVAGFGGWMFWVQRKNKYMASEADSQDKQNISLMLNNGTLDYGGDQVQINPNWNPHGDGAATDLRQNEIENRQKNTEKAHVDEDQLIWRQEDF